MLSELSVIGGLEIASEIDLKTDLRKLFFSHLSQTSAKIWPMDFFVAGIGGFI